MVIVRRVCCGVGQVGQSLHTKGRSLPWQDIERFFLTPHNLVTTCSLRRPSRSLLPRRRPIGTPKGRRSRSLVSLGSTNDPSAVWCLSASDGSSPNSFPQDFLGSRSLSGLVSSAAHFACCSSRLLMGSCASRCSWVRFPRLKTPLPRLLTMMAPVFEIAQGVSCHESAVRQGKYS